jgi:diketogulonate reductase-like aldo/keto reductase
VPWAESVGALEELRQEGKVQLVGVSNADPAQIREAASTTRLAAVQNELSPRFRSSEPEVEVCAELGVAFLPWSPLGGIGKGRRPRLQHAAFAEVAAERGVSPQRCAWRGCSPRPRSSSRSRGEPDRSSRSDSARPRTSSSRRRAATGALVPSR